MRVVLSLILFSMLAFVPSPSHAELAVYIFECERDEDATDEQLEAAASEWLNAAKQMKGGKDLRAFLRFPIVGKTNEIDVWFVVVAPSIEVWGQFWGNYNDSPADEVDMKHGDLYDCPNSSLWQAIEVE